MTNELSRSYSKALELHNKILVSAQLAQNNLWEMCSGLKEMRDGKLYKELGYQNFEEYCGTEFNMTARNARNYISIIENISEENRKTFSAFSSSKLMLLSTLSESEQEKITEENDVESMTVKQLESEIKNLRRANDEKKSQLQSLSSRLENAHNCENKYRTKLCRAEVENRELREQIEELENRPIEVAVAEPSDEVRQLKLTIKNLEKTTEDQLNTLQDNHLETEMKLRRENAEKLRQQANDYEKKLAEARQSGADDKQVFKAYFTAAFDAFNRMLEFAQKSEDKQFFKEKISSLISTVANANENM